MYIYMHPVLNGHHRFLLVLHALVVNFRSLYMYMALQGLCWTHQAWSDITSARQHTSVDYHA